MMRKLLLTILIGVLLGSATAYGGTHGILAGKVIDEEGKPMIGSTVLVKGTTRGTNVNNKDGSFTIVNIPAGDYEVVVRYVGYAEYVTKVRISADQTTTITARMRTDAQMTDEVVVVGDREMVEKDAVGSQVKISSEEVTQIAREGIAGVIGLSAGVNTTGSGFSVRGSRASETQIRVDGMDVGNQFTGGFGLGGTAYYPMVSSFATEEIQVLTGNFSAEYGEALGGVVNTIVKQGRTDRYEGFLRWRTDVEPLWGYQSDGVEIIKEGNVLKAISAGDGLKFQGPDLHAFDFGFGGPIPLLKNSTFYISSNYKFEKYRSNSYEVIDPYGNNIGQQDNDRTWVRSVTGRLRFGVTKDILLIVGGNWGLSSFEVPSWSWLYNQQHGQIPATANVEERIAQLPVANQLVSNALVRVNHTLSNNMFYEITVSNNSNNDDLAKRALGAYGDPGFFSGFEIWQPQDDYAIEGQNLLPGHNKILDNYESWTALGETADGYFQMDMPVINPLTGFYEGQANTSGTDNPWGLDRFTITHGNTTPVQIRLSNFWQVEGNFTASLKQGEFNHILKAGLEFKRFELHRHYNGNPYDSNPFFDVYTDKWGGNIYADNEEIFQRTSEPNTPIKASFYLQDQISYKGIILNPGLRFDVFDPNSEYRLETNENFVSVRADSGFGEASAKYQISPRINVSYPITDRSYVSIGYGMFFKTPELQTVYDKFALDVLRTGDLLGNPNMEAQRQNSYEAAYHHQLTEDFAFEVTAYYNDIYNQLGVQYIPAVPDPYFQYTVAEYGNARGLEFEIRKRQTDHVGFRLNYTLSAAEGTSASPTSNFNPPTDPYTGVPAFPLTAYPQPWDRTHQINGNVTFFWRNNEGPMIGGIGLLENTTINFSGYFQTGRPYTRSDKAGRPISEYNAERYPSVWSVDLRFVRSFPLKDWFGESIGNTTLDFFFDINNIFNNTQMVAVYSATGDPLNDGNRLETRVSEMNPTAWHEEAEYGMAETFSSEQYDDYGNRMYNANADIDGSGVVVQKEKYDKYIEYVETSMSFRGNFKAPRMVYMGFMIRF